MKLEQIVGTIRGSEGNMTIVIRYERASDSELMGW